MKARFLITALFAGLVVGLAQANANPLSMSTCKVAGTNAVAKVSINPGKQIGDTSYAFIVTSELTLDGKVIPMLGEKCTTNGTGYRGQMHCTHRAPNGDMYYLYLGWLYPTSAVQGLTMVVWHNDTPRQFPSINCTVESN